jgi:hypothetical protein
MPRQGSHRTDRARGPWVGWSKEKAYHLSRLFRVIRAADQYLQAPTPEARMRLRQTVLEARHYLTDDTGDVWR